MDSEKPFIAVSNELKLGEIVLSSNELTMSDLIKQLKDLLDHPGVKEYLNLVNIKKSTGGYLN